MKAMSTLLKRLCQLESQLNCSRGPARHSEEYRNYWCGQVKRALDGEKDVDLSGVTRELTDEVLADYREELNASGRGNEVWSD